MPITTNYAEVARELQGWIDDLDGKVELACNQALIIGVDAIRANLYPGHGFDTGNLSESYARCSRVVKLGPCQYQVIWSSDVSYQTGQEFLYSPHLRPGLHAVWPQIQALFKPLGIEIPASPFEGVQAWGSKSVQSKILGEFTTGFSGAL